MCRAISLCEIPQLLPTRIHTQAPHDPLSSTPSHAPSSSSQLLSSLHDAQLSKDRTSTALGGAASIAAKGAAALAIASPAVPLAPRLPDNSAIGGGLEAAIDASLHVSKTVRQRAGGEGGAFEVPEVALLRDVVFAMQGIDGKYLKFDKAEVSTVSFISSILSMCRPPST